MRKGRTVLTRALMLGSALFGWVWLTGCSGQPPPATPTPVAVQPTTAAPTVGAQPTHTPLPTA
ncbi:MAG TPA: hypothetical protein VEC93_14075, partial [Anaerolineae bacterium]|nr:hypothetical protein [Anaerolineae bacterium]